MVAGERRSEPPGKVESMLTSIGITYNEPVGSYAVMHSFQTRTRSRLTAVLTWLLAGLSLLTHSHASTNLDLSKATVVIRAGTLPPAEQTAARVLVEEIKYF